jgi:hypothetical protein
MRRILGLGVRVHGVRANWLGPLALVAALSASGVAAFSCTPAQTDAPPETPAVDAPAAGGAPAVAPEEPSTEGAGGAPASSAAPEASSAAPAESAAAPEPPPEVPAAKESKKASSPKATAPKAAETPKAETPKAEAPTAGDPPKDGKKPCKATDFQFSQVRAACASGGVDAAKSLMKQWQDKANAGGKDLKCTSCHTSTKTYALKGNAAADLRALL